MKTKNRHILKKKKKEKIKTKKQIIMAIIMTF